MKKIKPQEKDTTLEKEFEALYDMIGSEIQEKLNLAAANLEEAVKLSKKHGVPFSSHISFIRNTYLPSSFKEKFGKLDDDYISNMDIYIDDYNSGGWQHSAVC